MDTIWKRVINRSNEERIKSKQNSRFENKILIIEVSVMNKDSQKVKEAIEFFQKAIKE
jgi:hypothetical protein